MFPKFKRLSLKECWYYGSLDLVPESRTFLKQLLAFIERKTINVVWSQNNPNFFAKLEIMFWDNLEMKTRNFRKLLWRIK
jgi:hypothetical protein